MDVLFKVKLGTVVTSNFHLYLFIFVSGFQSLAHLSI